MMHIFIIVAGIWAVIWTMGSLGFLIWFLRRYWRFCHTEKRLGGNHHA